ncbi:MAG: GC-type dockerin domain-anchored protein [Planctomycetota bacterium]
MTRPAPFTSLPGVLLACITLLTASAAAQSADIVILGDSWGNRLSLPLLGSLSDAGLGETAVLNAAFEGERADDLASNDPAFGLPYIADVLAANPETTLVHLSIGGNDLFDGILFINNDAIVNSLLSRVVGDTETIVREILLLRPEAEVYHTGYDFLRPILFFSPARVNEVMLDLDARLIALADTIPGYTYEGFYGFAQLTFGIPELGIPPGDPSLPRLDLPSPASTFVDEIHYTPAVYRVMADELVERYYEPRLTADCLADVNGDGEVDGGDFFAWVAAFSAGLPEAEQNGDGLIDESDFFAWVVNFGQGC